MISSLMGGETGNSAPQLRNQLRLLPVELLQLGRMCFHSNWFDGQGTQMLKLTTRRLQQTNCRLLFLTDQKAGREGLGPSIGLRGGQGGFRRYLPMRHEIVQRS